MRVTRWLMPLAAFCIAAAPTGRARAEIPDPQGSLPRNCPIEHTSLAPADEAPLPTGDQDRSSADSLRLRDPGDQFNVSVAPYAWLTSQSGDATVRGISLDADVRFSDLLHDSDTLVALMGAIDVECNRFVFQVNAEYAHVGFKGSRGILRNGTVSGDITETLEWYEFLGGYRLLDRPLWKETTRRLTLDAFLGARLTAIELDAKLSASTTVTLPDGEVLTPGITRERDGSKSWVEPFAGARVGLELSDRWSLSLRGDVGGFGVAGAESAWSTAALLGYRWQMDGWTLAAFGGYRILGQDYRSGDFGWDVVTYGPLLGARFSTSF